MAQRKGLFKNHMGQFESVRAAAQECDYEIENTRKRAVKEGEMALKKSKGNMYENRLTMDTYNGRKWA